MRRGGTGWWWAAAAAVLGTGCAVGGGLGVLAGGVALAAGWLVFAAAAGGSSGCYASHSDLDAGDVGACLTARPDATDDVGPCLGTLPDTGPCLEPPMDYGPCLAPPADTGPCLSAPADYGPCLDLEPDAEADGLPICPPELCDVCLNSPIDWCILDCPPDDAGGSASAADPSKAATERVAAAGVLTADQVARLGRLRG